MPVEIERGVSLKLAQQRRTSLSNVNYSVSFTLNPKGPINGGVAINFDLKDKSEAIVIDFNAPKESLTSLNVNYRPAKFEFKNGHIIVPTENMEIGENAIVINFVAGDASLNRNEKFLYTLLVPDRASTVFPCFDQPDLKARFTLQLELPNRWKACANGSLKRSVDVVVANENGKSQKRKILTFNKTKPISTYLFGFAAGEFESVTRTISGREITMLHRESDRSKVSRNIDKIFETHEIALDWMEKYTGIAFPFEKLDFVLIPAFQYGGMEHVGNIFYNADQLLLDESATTDQKLNRANLIAHETAHMWFGNLVTMQWFDDVWLKEVFANFMAAKIVHPSFPKINHQLGFMMKHHPSAYGEDRTKGTYPIQQNLNNLRNAGTLYGRIIYQKAPIVMRQLETMIGENTMQSGLQEYLKKFSYKNAVWDDLIEILDKKTDINLRDWSDSWVKQSGTPEVKCEVSLVPTVKNTISVRQTRKTEAGKFWSQQVDAKVYIDGNMVFEKRATIDNEIVDIEIPKKFTKYDFVLVNSTELGYGYFELDRLSRKFLLQYGHEIKDDVTRGAARLALFESIIRADWNKGEAADLERFTNALMGGLESEMEPLNRQNLLNQLEIVYWTMLPPTKRRYFAPLFEFAIWKRIENKNESLDAKAAFFETLVEIATSQTTNKRLYDIWDQQKEVNGLKLSENDFIDLSYALAVRMPDRSLEILDRQFERIKNEDRRRRFLFVRNAISNDVDIRDQFFESLKDETNRRPERWVLEALKYLHHPSRASESEKYLMDSLELLEEIQTTGDIFFPKRWLVATLSGHRSATAAATVIDFLEKRPDYPANLKNKILQASDLLLRVNGLN